MAIHLIIKMEAIITKTYELKPYALIEILNKAIEPLKTLIFCCIRQEVYYLEKVLIDIGFKCIGITREMTKDQMNKNLDDFINEKDILIIHDTVIPLIQNKLDSKIIIEVVHFNSIISHANLRNREKICREKQNHFIAHEKHISYLQEMFEVINIDKEFEHTILDVDSFDFPGTTLGVLNDPENINLMKTMKSNDQKRGQVEFDGNIAKYKWFMSYVDSENRRYYRTRCNMKTAYYRCVCKECNGTTTATFNEEKSTIDYVVQTLHNDRCRNTKINNNYYITLTNIGKIVEQLSRDPHNTSNSIFSEVLEDFSQDPSKYPCRNIVNQGTVESILSRYRPHTGFVENKSMKAISLYDDNSLFIQNMVSMPVQSCIVGSSDSIKSGKNADFLILIEGEKLNCFEKTIYIYGYDQNKLESRLSAVIFFPSNSEFSTYKAEALSGFPNVFELHKYHGIQVYSAFFLDAKKILKVQTEKILYPYTDFVQEYKDKLNKYYSDNQIEPSEMEKIAIKILKKYPILSLEYKHQLQSFIHQKEIVPLYTIYQNLIECYGQYAVNFCIRIKNMPNNSPLAEDLELIDINDGTDLEMKRLNILSLFKEKFKEPILSNMILCECKQKIMELTNTVLSYTPNYRPIVLNNNTRKRGRPLGSKNKSKNKTKK